MTTPLAVVVLTHTDPVQLMRLIGALEDTPVVVHCDARTPADVYAQMTAAAPSRVRFVERGPIRLASWSLVKAEIKLLRTALEWTNARQIVFLSGADYPLVGMADLITELDRWAGHTWIENSTVPYEPWNTKRHKDGGLWRFKYRYHSYRDQALYWQPFKVTAGYVEGAYPLCVPIARKIPAELELRAASQWKVYDREHALRLLGLMESRPDLMKFWKSTLLPEESFVASMLASPAVFGPDVIPLCDASFMYLDWDNEHSGDHPRWLSDDQDFDRLKVARWAPPVDPSTAMAGGGMRKLFARKFGTAMSSDLLDRVDAELRL